MKAQRYLEQIEIMNAEIDADIEELAQLKALSTKVTTAFGDERVQSSGCPDKMAGCVIKIQEQKNRINAKIEQFLKYKEEAKQLILSACDPDCIRLLFKKYFGELNEETQEIEYKSWTEIAKEMNYTKRWVSNGLHQRALSQLQKALEEREEKYEYSGKCAEVAGRKE